MHRSLPAMEAGEGEYHDLPHHHCAGVWLLADPLAPALEIHSSARSPAPRQAVAVAGRAGSAHQGCHSSSALVLDICALSAGPTGCCWPRTVVTCWQLTTLRLFPCPVLLQLCSSPINSSISFIWKGVAAYHPFNARFRMLSLESPGSSEGWHLISTRSQKTALVLVFSYHNVSKTFQWKKEIQSI